ncbi:hypothetical protein SBA4_3800003 [Candidatus Sulfopaludibacter sp. SbA4]|nr:hypothetical protein SBA4_3800003 [Candidatus Sulfopaludibacter sp. SbA4]
MNASDALVFALLALADLSLMVHLRRARARRLRMKRMMRCLELAVERENAAAPAVPAKRWPALRRAS